MDKVRVRVGGVCDLSTDVSGQGCMDKVRVRVGGVCDLLIFLARVVWTR